MELFTVTDRCTGCGLCAKVCPASLVRQSAKGERPSPLAGREAQCIRCGHCVAVCKAGALVHGLLPSDAFMPIDRARLATPEALERLMRARRSCRLYDPAPLPREAIRELIMRVGHAPTGHNLGQVGFVVVDGPERMDCLRQAVLDWIALEVASGSERAARLHLAGAARAVAKGRDVLFRNAPHVVVVHAPANGVTPREDVIIAGAWLELAAAAAGYGACWCGYLMFALAGHPPIGALLGLPEGHAGYAALLLGRAAVRPLLIPPRDLPDIRFF